MKWAIFSTVFGSLLIITTLVALPINILAGNTSVTFTGILLLVVGIWRLHKGVSTIRKLKRRSND